MPAFEPRDPDYERKVRESFTRQRVMDLIGARLVTVEPGQVTIELPYREDLTQQHAFLHAGITTTIADSAGGYAAFSLMPPGASVLSIEFKVNLLAPARGELFRARGTVLRPGRRVFATELEVRPVVEGEEGEPCLFGLQTVLCLPDREDRPPA